MLKSLQNLIFSLGLAIVLFLGSLSSTAPVWAHALETNYAFDLMQSSLKFTSSFSTGEPLEHGTVEIYAPGNSETPWETLETDEAGNFSFLPDPEQPGEWTIKIGQEGHSDLWTVPVTQDGVEFDLISQGVSEDVHYAGLGSIWAGVLGAALGGFVYLGYKIWRVLERV
jgi:nickel transport protein